MRECFALTAYLIGSVMSRALAELLEQRALLKNDRGQEVRQCVSPRRQNNMPRPLDGEESPLGQRPAAILT